MQNKNKNKNKNEIVALARDWIGTPYHHQASTKGVGCDCLGLVRGVWRERYGGDIAKPPPYSPDWGETNKAEPLLKAAHLYLVPKSIKQTCEGDVLLFRMQAHGAAKHLGIITSERTMVHAMEGVNVSEVFLGNWWLRRRVGVFGFPDKAIAA